MKRQNGFTLVELMITVAIAAIILTLAVPNFRDLIMSNRLTGAANDFVASIQLARSSAIKHRRQAHIDSNNGTNWAGGWSVWIDKNSDGAQTADELLRTFDAVDASNNITFTGTQGSYTFNGMGIVDNSDTLSMCDSRSGEMGRQIAISAAGRVNTTRVACP